MVDDVYINWKLVRAGVLQAAQGFHEARNTMAGAAAIANGLRLVGSAIELEEDQDREEFERAKATLIRALNNAATPMEMSNAIRNAPSRVLAVVTAERRAAADRAMNDRLNDENNGYRE